MNVIMVKKEGQTLTEFVLVLPVFIFFVLGLLQLSVIFLKAVQLKYAAYMTARTAAAYNDVSDREKYADRAAFVLEAMMIAADNFNENKTEMLKNTVIDAGKSYIAKEAGNAVFNESTGVVMEIIELENSEYTDPGFVKLALSYDVPLKVPVVNRIIGLFQRDFRHKALEMAGYPVYTLTANAVMRIQ
ncbi:MAG TPA: pilus assembly protein [Firmicutes bacterium]|nr:pilus assembly protein [Bacillota bacterium]